MADPLDKILTTRQVPKAASNLAERIIEHAKTAPRKERFGPSRWWATLLDNMLMPQPALVMAVLLLLGLSIGFMTETAHAEDDILDLLVIEEELLVGEFL